MVYSGYNLGPNRPCREIADDGNAIDAGQPPIRQSGGVRGELTKPVIRSDSDHGIGGRKKSK